MAEAGPQELAGVHEGDILGGKYRVERVLGRGGMGVVVAARHIQLDERVALKFLLPEALGDAEAVARFAREARAAVKIKSEHVARVTDVGTLQNGAPYMVMEYLEGLDLAAWIRQRGALPIEQAVEFVLQACVAVAEAHALGIVHRDLKPANLFCVRRSDGQLSVKVLDFGISKMTDAIALNPGSMTRTSAMMGSPLYMSPEQMRSAKDVDALTDIWALGVIIFELLTGRHAFEAESVTELAIKVNGEPMPSIRNLRADVPGALEAVVGTCLEKDRRRRYRNVAELSLALMPFAPKRSKGTVDRISGIIQGAGITRAAPAPSGMVETQTALGTLPPVGRTGMESTAGSKKAVLGLGGAGLVLAVVGGVALLRWMPARHADVPAVASQAVSAPLSPSAQPQVLPAELPSVTDALPPEPSGAVSPLPPAASAASAVSSATLPALKKKTPPSGGVAPPAASAVVTTPVPPARAKCDPPYYFDANGSRIFKKECL